ncbi:MAG: hypothetical protein F6K35_15900, partial [Okeania sp. SIO2H7]|nr:hypothetical protein [Okeania sp. SIO2H7]
MDKFLQQIVNANNSFLETKLDNYGEELWKWMEDRFQIYAAWQHPKIWRCTVTNDLIFLKETGDSYTGDRRKITWGENPH